MDLPMGVTTSLTEGPWYVTRSVLVDFCRGEYMVRGTVPQPWGSRHCRLVVLREPATTSHLEVFTMTTMG
jgi:hypothetical protein